MVEITEILCGRHTVVVQAEVGMYTYIGSVHVCTCRDGQELLHVDVHLVDHPRGCGRQNW